MKISSSRFVLVVIAASVCGSFAFGINSNMRNFVSQKKGQFRTKLQASEDQTNDPAVQDDKVKSLTSNPLRLGVLRLGLTEPAWTSPFNYQKKEGSFSCAYCGQQLFDSTSQYDSGSGWPSFWRSAKEGAVALKMEWDGRLECKCSNCDSHLGHVFLDGPKPSDVDQQAVESIPASDPKGRNNSRLPRFCINGAAMTFGEENKM